MMIKSIKIQLKPNNKQKTKLFECAGVARWAYNWTLARQQENYKNGGKFIKDNELRKELTLLKKTDKYKWLNDYSNNITKQAIKDACNAYKRFFEGYSKFPKFKSKKRSKPSFYVDTCKIQFTGTHVKIEKLPTSTKRNKQQLNWIRLCEHYRIPFGENVKYINPRVSFDGINWWISVGIEYPDNNVVPTNEGIGIDLGVEKLATCSNGIAYKNINKTYKIKKLEKRKKRLQRKVRSMVEHNTKSHLVVKKKITNIYWTQRYLLLLLVPAIIYFIVFHYVPMYGVIIAFKDYKFKLGILGSPWVGLEHFKLIFQMEDFYQVFANTIIISFWKFLWGFPAPIIFALFLNEITNIKFKKTVQTISYLPHFVSWVVLGGILTQLLSPGTGPVNIIIKRLGFSPIYFLADVKWFRTVLVASSVWKNIGWGSIVYFAALSGVDQEIYEAAIIDGANRLQRMFHVTLPQIVPVITIMLIMNAGSLIKDDFDQIFNLYNSAVYKVGDVLSTYTYRAGLVNMEYSFATAVDLFKNVISVILVLITNFICKRVNEYSIW